MLGLSAYLIDDDLVCFPWRSCWSTSNALVWFWLSTVHVHAGRVYVCGKCCYSKKPTYMQLPTDMSLVPLHCAWLGKCKGSRCMYRFTGLPQVNIFLPLSGRQWMLSLRSVCLSLSLSLAVFVFVSLSPLSLCLCVQELQPSRCKDLFSQNTKNFHWLLQPIVAFSLSFQAMNYGSQMVCVCMWEGGREG